MFTSQAAINRDYMRKLAPSIFAESPWDKMSSKYQFIPTIQVIDEMQKHGLYPVSVKQSRSRIPGKGNFTKHMVRLRVENPGNWEVGQIIPEIVLVNSHDGTSSYQIGAGLYRLVCKNGMVVNSGELHTVRLRHQGNVIDEVIDATYRVIEDYPKIQYQVKEWIHKPVTFEQQLAYAESALNLRWEPESCPLVPEQLLYTRRVEDNEPTLWNTFQKVQENLIKGGLNGQTSNGRRRRTRQVKSVSEDIRLNRALWTLTEKMSTLV